MKYFSHLNTATQLLQQYSGSQPFGIFIKQFFSQHKKYGSKDRRNITQLCYGYFRLGKALPSLPVEDRILAGLFLCTREPNELLEHLKPEWNTQVTNRLAEKCTVIQDELSITDIFPWKEELSSGMDHPLFCESFCIQPNLFIRLRPGRQQQVKAKLQQAGLIFEELNTSSLALPNASKIDALIDIDREAVIQDYSSQRIGSFLELVTRSGHDASTHLHVWDACAASGGKSILAYDILPSVRLTVSDVRKNILINLEKRFAAAGIKNYQSLLIDLAVSTSGIKNALFDMIIADVPCSGSGTWSRTPEQLFFFDPAEIDRYSALQQKIVHNMVPHLRPGGWFLYCTCSVFSKENEAMVQQLQDQYHLQLHTTELLKGYTMKADTLFAALLQKQ